MEKWVKVRKILLSEHYVCNIYCIQNKIKNLL